MKKQNADRLELCQLISDGLINMETALLELLSITPPFKVRELIRELMPSDQEGT
jgi:hypothetical protein